MCIESAASTIALTINYTGQTYLSVFFTFSKEDSETSVKGQFSPSAVYKFDFFSLFYTKY